MLILVCKACIRCINEKSVEVFPRTLNALRTLEKIRVMLILLKKSYWLRYSLSLDSIIPQPTSMGLSVIERFMEAEVRV
jgi:hypothetical protein